MTSNSLTENEEHDIPPQILKDCMPQLFLDPNMCGFQYICTPPPPNSSGQLAELIKSPQYTGGDFMFLYRFVRRHRRRRRRRRRRPQIFVHAITFEQLFGFLSFLAQLLALTCRLPD